MKKSYTKAQIVILLCLVVAGIIAMQTYAQRALNVGEKEALRIAEKEQTNISSQTYTVERVIDGDTLKLTNGETVRLIGIDAPESRINDKARRDAIRTNQDLETITKMGHY